MYERTYGTEYDQNLSTTDIAKLIRSRIAGLKKEGKLDKGWKLSVRSDYFAGGSAIRLTITSIPSNVEPWNLERTNSMDPRYSAEVVAFQKLVMDMVGGYNHDGSESMVDYFDVNFYCNSCDLDWRKFPAPQNV